MCLSILGRCGCKLVCSSMADLWWETASDSRTTSPELPPVPAELIGEVSELLHCQLMERNEMQTQMAPL